MKKLFLITTPLLFAACYQPMPPMAMPLSAQPTLASLPTEAPRQGQYVALPGQAAVDTDAAFEQHAAAYTTPGVVAAPGAPVAAPVTAAPQPAVPGIVQPTVSAAATLPVPTPVTVGGVVNPSQPTGMIAAGMGAVADGSAALAGAAGLVAPTETMPAGTLVDYTLRITNATSGRVFVEAQDAAGEIYPCGFMTGSQSISSVKKQVSPIKGPITVVVRDPDKPGAPELRRYKVTPPAGYAGKTVEITIISGGLYQVSVDGQVRYITPTPVGKPDLGSAAATPNTPPAEATPAAPASPAPSPAAPAGPAPEQTPAGI